MKVCAGDLQASRIRKFLSKFLTITAFDIEFRVVKWTVCGRPAILRKKIIIGTNVVTHDAMVTKVTFKNLCVPLANQDDEYYILF